MHPTFTPAALAVVFAFSATPLLAEAMSVDGTGSGISNSKAMPISDDLVIIDIDTDYDGFDNPDSPFATAKGPCWGAVRIVRGTVSGGGLCHYTDADGDVAVVDWTATGMGEGGRTLGDWSVVGGTGKWAAASGGGTFDAGDSTGSYTNNVTGEVTMN